jgi:hypothetical protein
MYTAVTPAFVHKQNRSAIFLCSLQIRNFPGFVLGTKYNAFKCIPAISPADALRWHNERRQHSFSYIYPLHLLAHFTNVHIKSEYGALRKTIFLYSHLKIQWAKKKQQHFNRHKMQKLKIAPKAAVRDTITNTQRQRLS